MFTLKIFDNRTKNKNNHVYACCCTFEQDRLLSVSWCFIRRGPACPRNPEYPFGGVVPLVFGTVVFFVAVVILAAATFQLRAVVSLFFSSGPPVPPGIVVVRPAVAVVAVLIVDAVFRVAIACVAVTIFLAAAIVGAFVSLVGGRDDPQPLI